MAYLLNFSTFKCCCLRDFRLIFLVIRKYMYLCCKYDRVTNPKINAACSYMKVNLHWKLYVIWFRKYEYGTLVTCIVNVLSNGQRSCCYSFLSSFVYFSLFSPLFFFRIKISAYNPPFQKVHYNYFNSTTVSSQSCQTLATTEGTLLMIIVFVPCT